MATGYHRESAKIYAFPVKIRPVIASSGVEAKTKPDVKSPRVGDVVCGSWYHEAAIRDAERPHKA